MKIASTTFFCDAAKCPAKYTALEDDGGETAAYLDLIQNGWTVGRPYPVRQWKHFCPEHREAVTT